MKKRKLAELPALATSEPTGSCGCCGCHCVHEALWPQSGLAVPTAQTCPDEPNRLQPGGACCQWAQPGSPACVLVVELVAASSFYLGMPPQAPPKCSCRCSCSHCCPPASNAYPSPFAFRCGLYGEASVAECEASCEGPGRWDAAVPSHASDPGSSEWWPESSWPMPPRSSLPASPR
jgi:hypothetical protein